MLGPPLLHSARSQPPATTVVGRRSVLVGSAAVGAAVWAAPAMTSMSTASAVSGSAMCVCLDFDDLAEGTFIDAAHQPYASFSVGVTFTGDDPVNNPLRIFNSSAPTGGDADLGTPNADFGGPGIGSGGAAGTAGENSTSQGMVLIAIEDGTAGGVPNDNNDGGLITIDFGSAVYFESLGLLDVDTAQLHEVRLYDASSTLLQTQVAGNFGENSYQRLVFNQPSTSRVEVDVQSSYALSDLCWCEDDPTTPEPPTTTTTAPKTRETTTTTAPKARSGESASAGG